MKFIIFVGLMLQSVQTYSLCHQLAGEYIFHGECKDKDEDTSFLLYLKGISIDTMFPGDKLIIKDDCFSLSYEVIRDGETSSLRTIENSLPSFSEAVSTSVLPFRDSITVVEAELRGLGVLGKGFYLNLSYDESTEILTVTRKGKRYILHLGSFDQTEDVCYLEKLH